MALRSGLVGGPVGGGLYVWLGGGLDGNTSLSVRHYSERWSYKSRFSVGVRWGEVIKTGVYKRGGGAEQGFNREERGGVSRPQFLQPAACCWMLDPRGWVVARKGPAPAALHHSRHVEVPAPGTSLAPSTPPNGPRARTAAITSPPHPPPESCHIPGSRQGSIFDRGCHVHVAEKFSWGS